MQRYLFSLSPCLCLSVSLSYTQKTIDKNKKLKKKSRKWPPQNEGDSEVEACQDQRTWFISWGQEFLGAQCILLFEREMFPTDLFLNQIPNS